jgi:hypothetical protein
VQNKLRQQRAAAVDGHERERTTPLDPQTVAEFLAYDLPFRLEPSTGFHFPAEVRDA